MNYITGSIGPPRRTVVGNTHDVQYKHWVASIGLQFAQEYNNVPLFTTNAGSALWDAYIDHFPVKERDYHRCSHCKEFIERYGSLVTINANGSLVPVMWNIDRVPSNYRPSVSAMMDILCWGSKWKYYPQVEVTGVFISSKKQWGTPPSATWRHYHLTPPSNHIHNGWGHITANQRTTLYTENYQILQRALDKYYREPDYPLIAQAMQLANGHRLKGPLAWLYTLTQKMDQTPAYHQNNVVWLAATDSVPSNYFRIEESIVGRYLDRLLSYHPSNRKIPHARPPLPVNTDHVNQ